MMRLSQAPKLLHAWPGCLQLLWRSRGWTKQTLLGFYEHEACPECLCLVFNLGEGFPEYKSFARISAPSRDLVHFRRVWKLKWLPSAYATVTSYENMDSSFNYASHWQSSFATTDKEYLTRAPHVQTSSSQVECNANTGLSPTTGLYASGEKACVCLGCIAQHSSNTMWTFQHDYISASAQTAHNSSTYAAEVICRKFS